MSRHPPPPPWVRDFCHVFETEHAFVVSNIKYLAPQPPGNGKDLDPGEPFHLDLLKKTSWATDRFWYLGVLPKTPSLTNDPLFKPFSIPFNHLPIERVQGGYKLKADVCKVWGNLNQLLLWMCRVLQNAFLRFAPLHTCPPPSAASANYALIAASFQADTAFPPPWYQVLDAQRPRCPPFWLDKILTSRILIDFTDALPRRGLYVNTQGNWQLLEFLYIFLNANTPVWLAYPKGSKPPSDLAATLAPSKEAIQSVQRRSQMSAPGPSRAPPQELQYGYDR
ncbi:hypothetical protein QCA50_007899 [Cerrena zonata]|uniref:Uncharacterized protein n=1 Tax=Cerrena zonata TaxID=2478898 RepID=A0AAW0GGH8_9APHY